MRVRIESRQRGPAVLVRLRNPASHLMMGCGSSHLCACLEPPGIAAMWPNFLHSNCHLDAHKKILFLTWGPRFPTRVGTVSWHTLLAESRIHHPEPAVLPYY